MYIYLYPYIGSESKALINASEHTGMHQEKYTSLEGPLEARETSGSER